MSLYTQESPERCVQSMKKSGKLAVALLGIGLGVLLILLGSGRLTGKDDPDPAATHTPVGGITRTAEEYRADLETRMKAICSRVAGVGEVDVIVTLAGGCEYIYATDKKTTVGGESTSYVTVGSGGEESPIYVTERAPAIVGIGVVCTGGMDPAVRREVTALLSAAFGVGSNRIYVTGRDG